MKSSFLLILLVSLGLQTSFCQTKPNIIIIYTDDMGYADLGVQGSVKDIRTPNIDLLAKEGVRFTAGYVTAPQCSPSRAGLLTGRYQERFGFDEIPDGPLPLTETTIANRLQKAGYTTGQVGKWHLEPNAVTADWMNKYMPNAKPNAQGRYNQRVPDSLLNLYMPGNRGFHQFFTGYVNNYDANFDLNGNLLKPAGINVKVPGFRLDIQTEAALQFIKRNQKSPFFLYLAYYGPHVPLEATEKYLQRFPEKMEQRRKYALAMMSAIDDGVGQISAQLRQFGIDGNTMIIFASDNGAPLGITKEDLPITDEKGKWDGSLNNPMLGEKGMLTEGGIRVPFIIKWPKGLPKGKVYKKPVSTLDIAATAVQLAGLPKSKELDGVNLIPFLSGKNKSSPHEYLYWRFWTQTAVRDERWKFVNAGNKGAYLFDIENDSEEKNNLIAQHPEIAQRLKNKLEEWTKQLMPPGIPYKKLRNQESEWYNFYLKQN
jgi:arylsulfatase A-like enzyme